METPTSRVLQLLELLQSAEMRSVTELADRLEVNERTVRRYVQQLRDVGVPVESVRGRYGGYRLSAGYRMAPLILSDEEAVAVFLGLSRAQAASDPPDLAAQIALAKIRRLLPATSASRLTTLMEAAALSPSGPGDTPEAGVLLTVSDAVRERRPLDLRYRDADGTPSRRTVHPYDLIAYSGRWYLRALDVDRQEERTFRIDRIRSARALVGSFASSGTPDPLPRLIDGFAVAEYPWHILLRIRATEEQIRMHLPASIAVLQPLDDSGSGYAASWRRVEIRAKRLDWLPAVIAELDGEVIIDEPDELRKVFRSAATRLLQIADGGQGRPLPPRVSPEGGSGVADAPCRPS
ncbi:MAG TPA: YafY family protein [Gryllotalpicola sp.]